MTNREIKKYKQRLAAIVSKFNEPPIEGETFEQQLRKKDEIIGEFQDLAIEIGALHHLGTEIQDVRQMLLEAYEKKLENEQLAAIGIIGKLHYQDILYALQTEMMFNACIFAKWSCFWAAIAATVACISIILTVITACLRVLLVLFGG